MSDARTRDFMNRASSRIVGALCVILLLAACAPANGEPEPPKVVYGIDVCVECNMIISDPRFASATLTTDGMMSKFDDIGDMFLFHAKHPELEVRAWFVHDYTTEEWMRGETAFYVESASVHSPMGHGIAAFKDRGAAESFAREVAATVLTFDELRAEAQAIRKSRVL